MGESGGRQRETEEEGDDSRKNKGDRTKREADDNKSRGGGGRFKFLLTDFFPPWQTGTSANSTRSP